MNLIDGYLERSKYLLDRITAYSFKVQDEYQYVFHVHRDLNIDRVFINKIVMQPHMYMDDRVGGMIVFHTHYAPKRGDEVLIQCRIPGVPWGKMKGEKLWAML